MELISLKLEVLYLIYFLRIEISLLVLWIDSGL